MLNDTGPAQSLEERNLKIQYNGVWKEVPALHKNWISKDKVFSVYKRHPTPGKDGFVLGAKETWLELMDYLIQDLEWLLGLEHHKFWSQMIFSNEPHQLLTSFLQEAPPFYLQSRFPKDPDMLSKLKEVEHLVFLVFIRLSTEKESQFHFISPRTMGQLLYDNYIFTVPILLDICVLYGQSNHSIVSKMVKNVFKFQPKYLHDFKEAVPHLVKVLDVVANKFQDEIEEDGTMKLANKRQLHSKEVRDLCIYLYDSMMTLRIFLDIYPDCCDLFHRNSFEQTISNFYSTIIPLIYDVLLSRKNCEVLSEWNLKDMLDKTRLELISIFHTLLSFLLKQALECDKPQSESLVEEYLTILTDTLCENLFMNDYNNIYPVESELDVLMQLHPDLDKVKLDFILVGMKTCLEAPKEKDSNTNLKCDIESLIKQVKDVLPHLGSHFIESCLEYYHYKSEDVLTAILENNLPPSLSDLNLNEDEVQHPEQSQPIKKHKNLNELLNDKDGIRDFKERYSKLGIVVDETIDYDDEFDDTYEGVDVSVREEDDPEKVRRPFVVPRVLAPRTGSRWEDDTKGEYEEEEEDDRSKRDYFVQNPEEIRAKAEEKRNQKYGFKERDVVGRPKGQGQDKNVVVNRDHKNVHKSTQGNHNRRKLADRKRNKGMFPA